MARKTAPSSLKPEDKPTLDEVLSIQPSDERVERLRALLPIDEPGLTPEIYDWLLRREVKTISIMYNQILAGVRITEEAVDRLLINAIDTHVHGASDPMERLLYEDDIAIDFMQAGMRAMVVKTWYTPSASRNGMLQRLVDRYAEEHGLRPLQCFGGITLNYSVGGFNVDAVKKCLGFPGMKYVWMPMVDSYQHRRLVYDDWSGYGLKYTDDHFRIIPEVQEILRVIADNDLVLATGHYGYEDSAALIEEARRLGVRRIEVVHPSVHHSRHTIEQMKEQAARGAKLCLMTKGMLTFPLYNDPIYSARMIKEVGAQHFVNGGDWGQIQNIPHLVGTRWAVKILLAFGITQAEILAIFRDAPAELLGLEPWPATRPVPHVPRSGSGRATGPLEVRTDTPAGG